MDKSRILLLQFKSSRFVPHLSIPIQIDSSTFYSCPRRKTVQCYWLLFHHRGWKKFEKMDAVACCGVANVSFPPRECLRQHHVIIPRRIGRLVFYNHQLNPFKIMAKKPPLLYFVDPDPYENDDITIHVEDDVNKDNSKAKKSLLSCRMTSTTHSVVSEEQLLHENAYDDLESRGAVTSSGEFEVKLRKPGVIYEDSHRSLPKKKQVPSSYRNSRSEDIINLTLLEKPEVGKPYGTRSRPDFLAGQGPSVVDMISKSYKPQKTKYELYYSRPIEVSLNSRPEVMQTKPDIANSAPSKSLEQRDHEPKTLYHPNPGNKQKMPSFMRKFTEPAGIDLRKPSIPTDNYKTDSEPEPKLNRLLDMRIDSSLSSQADPDSELELKTSSDKVRSSRGALRNVMIEAGRLNITDLRKPDLAIDDKIEIGTKSENNPSTLLEEHRHDYSDLNDIILKERRKAAVTDLDELELKPKVESNTETIGRYNMEDLSNVLLHKKPNIDVGIRQTNQVIDRNEPMRNGLSDAGDISSEEVDWRKAEKLLKNRERIIVELAGYNDEGFFATLGSIVGFIPYQNLGIRYQFIAFESWLRKKKVDLTLYQRKVQNTGSIGSMDSPSNLGSDTCTQKENEPNVESPNSNPTLNFEDSFLEYQQEKDAFLSSIIGQKLKVTVSVADRSTKEVVFTGLRKEHQDLINTKRNLMARLTVGDIVTCCITRFTQFGIFVEVEGVSALIPRTEVHFDGILDLLSSLELGQTLDAKVHRLDYQRDRIVLSLKDVAPDAQNDDFESVIGEDMSFSGTLQAAQPEEEWEDVESLIKELEKLEEVDTISKGTFFISSGLAPTFQVYMAPMVDDKYRLLARFGNKVQEVLVQASMDEERMKNTISACTSRIT